MTLTPVLRQATPEIRSVVGPWTNPAPRNQSGSQLVDLCARHILFITNTFFKHKHVHRDTFTTPDGKTRHMLDLALSKTRHHTSILDTRVKRGARGLIESDHELVMTKIRIKLRANRGYPTPPRINSSFLVSSQSTKEGFQEEILKSYEAHKEKRKQSERRDDLDPITEWQSFKTKVIPAATKACGHSKRRLPHFMTPELLRELEDKNKAFRKLESAKNRVRTFKSHGTERDQERLAALELEVETLDMIHKAQRKLCTKSTRKAKRRFWAKAAAELEEDFSHNRAANAYKRLRPYIHSSTRTASDLKDKKGRVLTSAEDKIERWAEHYGSLLSTDRTVDEKTLQWQDPDADANKVPLPVPEPPPSLQEVREVVHRLKKGRAPGACQISAEMLQYGGTAVTEWLHDVISAAWRHERTPQDWRHAVMVTIFKKGDMRDCDNYRGLSLQSVPGKVYALLLLKKVAKIMDSTVLECQSGFRPGRSTADHLFSLNQLFSNAIEFRKPLHACFIDLRKAYDTVNREALWHILRKTGISDKLLRLLRELHSDNTAVVKAYNRFSKKFTTNNGVRQGCVIAPTLFNIFLDHVIRHALSECAEGITIKYTIGNEVISLRLTEDICVEELVQILMYADDMTVLSDTPHGLELLVQRLDDITQRWLLDISQEKTKFMVIDLNGDDTWPKISLRGERIHNVEFYKYLGRTFSDDHTLDREISNRLDKATKAFHALKAPLFCHKEVSTKSKMSVFNSVVIPTLLYGTETWAIHDSEIQRLERFQNRCLRVILNVFYATHGRVSNRKLRKRARHQPSIEQQIRTRRLRWFGHVYRMDPSRLPNKMLTAQPPDARRPQGRRFFTWRELLRSDFEQLHITNTWQNKASVRTDWKKIIKTEPQESESIWKGRLRPRCWRQR